MPRRPRPGHSRKCAVPSCVTNYSVIVRFGVNLRFFTFPKDKSTRNEWLIRCNKSLDVRLTKNDTICSRHFHIDDYEDGVESTIINAKPKRLKSKAVPSLFLENRSQKLLKRNSIEYHKILAQEILKVEKEEACKSSEPPIYLEFSQCENIVQHSKSPNTSIETDLAQQSDDMDPLEGFGDYTSIDVKEESIIKPYVDCEENCAEENAYVKIQTDDENLVGNCYVCDKIIRQDDIGQISREDFTKIVQKVLEGVATEYVIVVTENDGLCSVCRGLVARITRLEGELRTASLGLRALLRLKYSLPPPVLETNDYSKVQVKFQQHNSSSMTTAAKAAAVTRDKMTQTVIQFDCSSSMNAAAVTWGHNVTQPAKKFYNFQKHKLTQTAPNIVVGKHKKTQTNEPSPQNKPKKEIKIVSSVNEVERLEKGDLEENDSGRKSECIVQVSASSGGISDAAELTTLLNNHCLAEEGGVITESEVITDSGAITQSGIITVGRVITEDGVITESRRLEVKQPAKVKRKPTKTKLNLGVLKCARCSYKTRSPEQMKEHMLSFINEENFYCSICDYAYHKIDHYRRHKIGHSEKSKNKRCIFCDDVVHDELHMRFHIEAKHKPNPFTHRCSVCNRVFMFGHVMRRHQRIKHKMQISISCEKCDKTFSDKVKYDSHVEYYHRDNLDCKYCQRPYFTIEKLIHHENSTHRFERTQHYQCSYCPKKFVRQDLLPRHEQRHTGQFPHRCDDCGYGFHDAVSLGKHLKTCKIFLKSVRSLDANPVMPLTWPGLVKQRLRKYQREPHGRHDSMVCDVCGKVIVTRQKYKIHRDMHDSPACFQCHVCGKEFRYKNNMDVHIRNLHTDAEQAE